MPTDPAGAESARKWREKTIRESMAIGHMCRDFWRMAHSEDIGDFAWNGGLESLTLQLLGVVATIHCREIFRSLAARRIFLRFARSRVCRGQ
jgi:hypothetical protein